MANSAHGALHSWNGNINWNANRNKKENLQANYELSARVPIVKMNLGISNGIKSKTNEWINMARNRTGKHKLKRKLEENERKATKKKKQEEMRGWQKQHELKEDDGEANKMKIKTHARPWQSEWRWEKVDAKKVCVTCDTYSLWMCN